MTGDDHTIDLTHDGAVGAPVTGNGANGLAKANGHGVHATVGAEREGGAALVPGGELDGIEWYPTYDRESVERHLRELDAERDRLNAEIAEAERRTEEAEATLAARTAEIEAGLGAVVVAARSELARIDRERDEAVEAIRAEAEAEAARIREAARVEADSLRGAASSLSAHSPVGETRAD